MDVTGYHDQVMGCWLGKACGGTLGMPYEGLDGPFNLSYYDPAPAGMTANDDLDLQVLWACLLEQQQEPEVSRRLFSRAWKENINFPWDEYGVCIRNLREGIEPPHSGAFDNWFSNGMGAAIRSEIWACLAPGNPQLAAAYAYEDACLDHQGPGIQAEIWLAAMQSAAFGENDISKIIQTGLSFLAPETVLRNALEDTCRWWESTPDWRPVRDRILQAYGHENFTDVTANMAFILLALLDGNGSFSRSVCTAVNCGKDTDCTAATVGALLGIINPDGIGRKWLQPIGRDLILSPEINFVRPPASLDEFTDRIVRLRRKLNQKLPPKPEETDFPPPSVTAGIGFKEIPWFGAGWPLDETLKLELPTLKSVSFPGTAGTFNSADFKAGAMFVEYSFTLKKETDTRVFFNTGENCRVFVNEKYRFGREGGRMAPSPHRLPINQSADLKLAAGRHKLTAAIARPKDHKLVTWVAGVADLNDNRQWIPAAFR